MYTGTVLHRYGTNTIPYLCNNCCTRIFLTLIVKWLFLIGWTSVCVRHSQTRFLMDFFLTNFLDTFIVHIYERSLFKYFLYICLQLYYNCSTIVLCIVAKILSSYQQYCCKKRKEKICSFIPPMKLNPFLYHLCVWCSDMVQSLPYVEFFVGKYDLWLNIESLSKNICSSIYY